MEKAIKTLKVIKSVTLMFHALREAILGRFSKMPFLDATAISSGHFFVYLSHKISRRYILWKHAWNYLVAGKSTSAEFFGDIIFDPITSPSF